MKMVPFFADTIVIIPHTATHEIHVGEPLSLKEFGSAASAIALYEMPNGDLRCTRTIDGAFIEGPELAKGCPSFAPAGAEVVKREALPPMSVQIQTTFISEDGAEICDQNDTGATHWSVYLRATDGTVEHVEDFKINPDTRREGNGGMAKLSALARAARLSMEHSVYIEQIK